FVFHYKDLAQDNRFEYKYLATIERQGTAWVETGARAAPEEMPGDILVKPPIWATGSMAFDRSGHFLTLYRPGLPHLREALSLAEKARSQLLPKALTEFDSVHLLQLARDSEEYRQFVASPQFATSSGLAIFQFSGDQVSGQQLPVNRYIVLNNSLLVGSQAITPLHGEDRTPVQVVQHELGHLALFRYDTPDTPNWLAEGGAQYLSGERRVSAWKRGMTDGSYNSDGYTIETMEKIWEMKKDDPLKAAFYPVANAAVLALVEIGGPEAWYYYYKGYKYAADFKGGVQQAKEKTTDILLQRFYQFDRSGLDSRMRTYMRKATGLPEP
ncbi:MAG: hypothetical protein LC749_19445, partial [Actinobacteria bacterium]|nr:hypothetical protein [Actinomycetota bacterium]